MMREREDAHPHSREDRGRESSEKREIEMRQRQTPR